MASVQSGEEPIEDVSRLKAQIAELERRYARLDAEHFTLQQRHTVALIKRDAAESQLHASTSQHLALGSHSRRQQEVLGKTFRELNATHTLLDEASDLVDRERRTKHILILVLVLLLLVALFWAAYFVLASTTTVAPRTPAIAAAQAAKRRRG